MTTLREAAQQALEALGSSLYPQPRQVAAIAALRAALAEPDEFIEDETIYCPTCGEEDGGTTCGMPDCGLRCGAEPVQEPVASVTECEACFTPDVCQLRGTCDHYAAERLRVAAPPQREPLTEEEIDELAMDEDGLPNSHLEFARAIERAHGIGGDA